MAWFLVSTRGEKPTEVEAPNWLSALGIGLEDIGAVASIDRLACEVLPNGTVLIRDARSGQGFVVQPSDGQPDDTEEDLGDLLLMPEDEDTEATEETLRVADASQRRPEMPSTKAPAPLLDDLLQEIDISTKGFAPFAGKSTGGQRAIFTKALGNRNVT